MPRNAPFTAHVPGLRNKEGIRHDVVGVGNALVDMIAMVPESFLDNHEMVKGSMALIETDRALLLTRMIGDSTRSSGGSGANTVAGVANLGGDAAFVGKVSDDDLGREFAEGLSLLGVDFHTGGLDVDVPTGRCVIAVTPDAQRTMNTYLGSSSLISFDDVDDQVVIGGAVLYLEGYVFDLPDAKAAFHSAAALAHEHG
ncbi:MAG: hypothetical protein RLY50_192, partial [Actinomycetota bacterium]